MVLRQFALVLVLLLLGWGCKGQAPITSQSDATLPKDAVVSDARISDAPVSDANSSIPAGWKVYENKDWKVTLAYPGEWHYRQLPEQETGDSNSLVVVFNQEPIVPLPDSDPVYPLMLTARIGTIVDDLANTRNAQTPEQVIINGRTFTKVLYEQELVDLTFVSYMLETNGKIYAIEGLASLPELENIVVSFTVTVQS